MDIERIILRQLALPLKTPFKTSYGTITDRHVILVEVIDTDDNRGFGEAHPISPPSYTEESVGTAWHILRDYLSPIVLQSTWNSPKQLNSALTIIRRNYTAKAGIEGAIWDLHARKLGISLANTLNNDPTDVRPQIQSGIALGIPPDIRTLLSSVENAISNGYRRIKIKVQPGWDIKPLRELRRHFGNIPLSVDANAAYSLGDIDVLRSFDDFGLDMIEQPLGWEDIVDHAHLQSRMETPLCLDESITSIDSARQAIELESCRIMNIKIGRVGGLTNAIEIHDLCRNAGVPVWCGGMLETGVGRAHALALASLPNFTLPADLSPSSRYFTKDIICPDISFSGPGFIAVPTGPGIGVTICEDTVKTYTVKEKVLIR